MIKFPQSFRLFSQRQIYNKVTLIGHLGKDPELVPNTETLHKFSLATNRSYKQNDEYVNVTDWHKVETNRNVSALHKGSGVLVEGHLRSWQKEIDGQIRSGVVVYAERIVGLK